MADEEPTIVSSEPAQPTIAEQQPVDEPQAIPDTEPVDPGAVETPPAEDDGEDFEWNGQSYRGPKGIKDGILMHKDYTQKRQADAVREKANTEREAELERRFEAADEELDLRSNVRTLDAQLAEYAKLTQADWDSHTENNPIETEKHWRRYLMLKEQRNEAAKALEGKQTERTAKAQQDSAKRWQDTAAYAAKEIPGWSKETSKGVFDYAEREGVPADFIDRNMSPTFLKVLHHAMIGAQTLSTPAPKPVSPTPAAPLKVVAAKSAPTNRTDLAKMDNMDDYIAARKKGVGGPALRAG